MFKSVKNNKGFTLIELLAVIVIMGVLMMVAIPQVTKYINNSRKDAYVDTAKAYINGARYMLLNDEFQDCSLSESGTNTILLSNVSIESGGDKSGYGRDILKNNSWIEVKYDSSTKKYVYSIYIVDSLGNGIATTSGTPVQETSLSRGKVIQKNVKKDKTVTATCKTFNADAE